MRQVRLYNVVIVSDLHDDDPWIRHLGFLDISKQRINRPNYFKIYPNKYERIKIV